MHRSLSWLAVLVLAAAAPRLIANTDKTERSPSHAAVAGKFAFNETEHCVYASGFGPPPMLQAVGPVSLQTTTAQGVVTLEADGTGQVTGRMASIQETQTTAATPALQSSFTCSARYQLAAKGEFRLQRDCRGVRLRGNGSAGAQTWSVELPEASGYLRGDLLLLTDTGLAVEALSVVGIKLSRLCHRSLMAMRLE